MVEVQHYEKNEIESWGDKMNLFTLGVKSLLAILITAFYSNFAFANLEMKVNLEKLHFNVPNYCGDLVEQAPPSEGGPFQKTSICEESQFANTQFLDGVVYRIVDGDTIHFYLGSKIYAIRMLGIDTPELHILGKAQPKWGDLAKVYLQRFVAPGDRIRLEFDQVKCDKYGRVLAHVYKGSTNLNFEQVKGGMAVNYCIAPNMKHCSEYAAEVRRNISFSQGIFSDKCMVPPYVWRKALQGQEMSRPVENIKTGAKYPGADYYKVALPDRVFF